MPGLWGVRPIPLARLALVLWASSQSGCLLIGYDGLGKASDAGFPPADGGGQGDGSAHVLRDGSVGADPADAGLSSSSDADAASGSSGADAGDDAGDNAPFHKWWEGIAPTTCGGIAGTACNQNCAVGSEPCVLDCSVFTTCGSTCGAYTKCRSTCSNVASCGHTCAAYATCSYESAATQTNVTCAYGSTCDVTCTDAAMCNLDCVAGASCFFRCKGLTCNVSCAGVKLVCDDGSVVCDRECPK